VRAALTLSVKLGASSRGCGKRLYAIPQRRLTSNLNRNTQRFVHLSEGDAELGGMAQHLLVVLAERVKERVKVSFGCDAHVC